MIKTVMLDKPGIKELTVKLEKEREDVEVYGLVKAEEPGEYTLNILMDHLVGKNNGRVTIRGIAKNGARVVVNGMIKIREGSDGVDDFLEMRILLLDDQSTATAKPKLEIEANQVKASHAATVGQIDPEQLFYLKSRGINQVEAEKLIVDGFLGEIIDKISNSDTVTQ